MPIKIQKKKKRITFMIDTDFSGKIGSQVESVFSPVKLVILILPWLNMHSDKLKKLFLEPSKLSLEKNWV